MKKVSTANFKRADRVADLIKVELSDIILRQIRKSMDNTVAPRQEIVIVRGLILIVYERFLAHIIKDMVHGQFRSEGIPIRPDMRSNEEGVKAINRLNDPVKHLPPRSRQAACLCGFHRQMIHQA